METIFTRVLENNFSEFNGLVIDASVPLTESLVDEMIAAALRGNQELTYCHIKIQRENRIVVEIKSTRWPWPFQLKLRLFGAMDLTHSPTVRAFLENNLLLGKLGALLNALPPGIRIYEDQVSVDLGQFLNSPEQKRLLSLIKAVEIKTEAGKIIFDVKIEK